MEEIPCHEHPEAELLPAQEEALDKLIQLMARTSSDQLDRVLRPEFYRNPNLFEAVKARLRALAEQHLAELRKTGRDGETPIPEHVSAVLGLMATRLEDSGDHGYEYRERQQDIARIEQWGRYLAILQIQHLDPMTLRQDAHVRARRAVACLSNVFARLERLNLIPGLRKRLTRQVEDVLINIDTDVRQKLLATTATFNLSEPNSIHVASDSEANGKRRHGEIAARRARRESRLLPILEARQWTLNKWATRAGVYPSIVYNFMNGKTVRLGDNTRVVLATALGVTDDVLM